MIVDPSGFETELAARVSRLSEGKRALLERFLRREGLALEHAVILPRERRDAAAPVTVAQEQLWFLWRLEPDTAAYNVPVVVRLRGPLRVDLLESALARVVARHEILRTRFTIADGTVVQVTGATVPVHIPVEDLTAVPADERERTVQRRIREEALLPFDLTRAPLFRFRVLRTGRHNHTALVTMHHIVSDAWSLRRFLRDLAAYYASALTGEPAVLPRLPIQYADFAAWQRRRLHTASFDTDLAYWRTQLAGCPPVLNVPTDRPRPSVPSFKGANRSAEISRATSEALRALARREGVTPFMLLLATFNALLFKYTAQTDLVVGCPLANRTHAATSDLIGLFVNPLVLRTDVSGNPTFTELLARVRQAALGAYAHPDVPFALLVEHLQPVRDVRRSPVFQVMFNVHPFESAALEFPGLTADLVAADAVTSIVDLTLYVHERADRFALEIVYATDLFDDGTAARALEHYTTLLTEVVADPNRRLTALPAARDTDDHGLVSSRPSPSGVDVIGGRVTSLGERFAAWARQSPAWPAIGSPTGRVTYGALDAMANRIGRALLRRRGRRVEPVGLLMDHDALMVAVILGVLKSGRSYVPLDATAPVGRLAEILTDCGAGAVVTAERHRALAASLGVDVVTAEHVQTTERCEAPPLTAAADDPAYLLYTSGSMGRPKGVVQTHGHVLGFMDAYTHNLAIGPTDRLTLLPAYGFDAAVMDIFGALLNGATLCPWDVRTRGLTEVPAWLRAVGATIYHSTPTVYRHLIGALPGAGSLPDLRLVVLGGEPVFRWGRGSGAAMPGPALRRRERSRAHRIDARAPVLRGPGPRVASRHRPARHCRPGRARAARRPGRPASRGARRRGARDRERLPGARVLARAGGHGRGFPARPGRRPAVLHRRPRAAASGRHARIRRSQGLAAQDSRPPRRTRGYRAAAPACRRHQARRGDRPDERRGGHRSRRVRGRGRRRVRRRHSVAATTL
jgi:non-ribosomal peptide synthetase component F